MININVLSLVSPDKRRFAFSILDPSGNAHFMIDKTRDPRVFGPFQDNTIFMSYEHIDRLNLMRGGRVTEPTFVGNIQHKARAVFHKRPEQVRENNFPANQHTELFIL